MPGATQEADPRPFECSICQARFLTKRNRKRHIDLVHENSGRFGCAYCDKRFDCRLHVENHERSHTGERPFRCKICKKALSSKRHLKEHHLFFHSEEKKIRCEVCDKLFATKIQLRAHLQCHSNERFECDQCGLSYQRRGDLKKHQARHHSATKQETSRRRRLAGGKEEEVGLQANLQLKAVLPDRRDGSPSVTYNLRTRSKTANYRDELEDVEFDEGNEIRSPENRPKSGDHLKDDVDETSEPDEAATVDDVRDEEQSDQIENNRDISAVPHAMREHVQDASPMIILSSDDEDEEENEEEDGQHSELAMETNTISNVTLKLVYDVEYRAPE